MKPTLPPNVTVGQVRRTVGLTTPEEWRTLSEDQRAAVDALSVHVHWRARQQRHPAFDGDDETFLTVGWMRGLLRVVGARKTSDRVAAAAIGYLESSGLIVDTGRVKTPRRRPDNGETVEPFQRWGRETMVERAAPSLLGRSYWWRVFRVPALTKAREAVLPKTAYTRTPGRPLTPVGSLSAFLSRQGLIPRPRRRSRPNPGSVQWAFLDSGPP